MTLKGLRSKCLLSIRQHVITDVLPDVDGAVRASLRFVVRELGGFEREDSISSVVGTREYDLPTDFMACEGLHDDTNDRWLSFVTLPQRFEDSTGDAYEYYIRAKKVGFELIPANIVEYTMMYLGYGDNVTSDDDTILSEHSIDDDDSLWDPIVYRFGCVYWDKVLADAEIAGDKDRMGVATAAYDRRLFQMNKALLKYRQQLSDDNADQAMQSTLPGPYFLTNDQYMSKDHGRIVRRR